MSRNRRMNWERVRRESTERSHTEQISGPINLPVRRNLRVDGWVENKRAKWECTCSVCGETLRAGEAVQMKPPMPGRNGRWLVRHATCAPPG